MGTNIVRIHGEKANLCLFRDDEEAIELYAQWLSDEDIAWRIGHNNSVLDWKEEREYVVENPNNNEYRFNIVDIETGTLIGNCSIMMKPRSRNASLGILIGDHDFMNKGIGTEVIKLLIKFGFEELNAHRVSLTLDSDNKRAYRCYCKAGLVECGREHETSYHNGHYSDTVYMEILKSQYME